MKYLIILLLCMATNVVAQTIDCQSFAKMKYSQSNQKKTSRSQTISTGKNWSGETLKETDATGNHRMVSKNTTSFGTNELELITINGIHYTKNNRDNIWRYKAVGKPDSSTMNSMLIRALDSKPTYENCKKAGSETIDGINYDIIESTMTMKSMPEVAHNIRLWVNFQDSTIRRRESVSKTPNGLEMKMVTDYGIAVATIEKPQNAVPDTSKNTVTYERKVSKDGVLESANYKFNPSEKPNAEYKEGSKALFSFLQTQLVYPQAARDAKIEGTVYLKFMVEPDGSITEITVARGIGYDCDQAAIDLLKKTSGNWSPALASAKPIRSPFTLPIKFKL